MVREWKMRGLSVRFESKALVARSAVPVAEMVTL
jgi:hypothetical protein